MTRRRVAAEDAVLADESVCELCIRPFTVIGFEIGRHQIEVRSCGSCGWHTRSVDGVEVSQDELLSLLRADTRDDTEAPPG